MFTALLGVIDESAKGLLIQKLTPKMPSNAPDQKTWFEPYLASVDKRMVRHYEEVARNLRKTLVYKNGLSPLGLLRSALDYALNDNAKLTGVFEAVKSELRFTGGRDLLDRVTAINEFRNTKVAHQETPADRPCPGQSRAGHVDRRLEPPLAGHPETRVKRRENSRRIHAEHVLTLARNSLC